MKTLRDRLIERWERDPSLQVGVPYLRMASDAEDESTNGGEVIFLAFVGESIVGAFRKKEKAYKAARKEHLRQYNDWEQWIRHPNVPHTATNAIRLRNRKGRKYGYFDGWTIITIKLQ